MNTLPDSFGALSTLTTRAGAVRLYRLAPLAQKLDITLERLPFSIRIVLEAALRVCDG